MAATAQLNVRLDPELKATGDTALASIGLTPSEAVRLVWTRAAERGEGLAQIEKLAQDAQRSRPAALHDNSFEACWDHISQLKKDMGIEGVPWSGASDEELYLEALYERMEERNLL